MRNKPVIWTLIFIFSLLSAWITFNFISLSITQSRNGHNLINYSQNTHQSTKKLEAWRGKIFDRNGHEIVSTRRSYDISFKLKKYKGDNNTNINWVQKKDIKKIAKSIAPIIDVKPSFLEHKLNTKNVYELKIGKPGTNLTQKQKDDIDHFKFKGISFESGTARYYSDPYLGSLLLGYTKKNSDNIISGVNGIEAFVDKELAGKDGYETTFTDGNGYKLPHTKVIKKEKKNPSDVYLTIDQHIQSILDREVSKGQKDNDAEWVMGIITDANSGKVLGASATPGFNLDKLDDIKIFNSPLANESYEPGSAMKVFTWANALENNCYNGSAKYKSGKIDVGSSFINDHVRGGWGDITYDQGFYRSSNVAAIKLTRDCFNNNKSKGYKNWLSKLSQLGFGKKTGIEIDSEHHGLIPKYTIESEIATTTFGQNILVNPFQMMQGLSGLSSKEQNVYKPRLVEKIKDSQTKKVKYKYDKNKNILVKHAFKQSTANKVRDLMRLNVSGEDPGRTGSNFAIDGYEVGVKTGSAQIADEISKYSQEDDKMLLSGFSMAPAKNPKINVYIAMKRPKSGLWNVPLIYKPIVSDVLSYLGEEKSFGKDIDKTVKKVTSIKMPSLVNMKRKEATKFLDNYGFRYIILGDKDQIIDQFPNNNELKLSNDIIILKTDEKLSLPDLRGYSYRDAVSILNALKIKYKINGSGYVKNQSVAPHQKVKLNQEISLDLS